MAAMTTALTEFADNGNSRTYSQSGHTALKPQLVIQKRKVPSGNQTVIEDVINVISATPDVDGVILPQRVVFSATIRRPKDGAAADTTAMLAVFRDIVASDEFTTMVNTQNFVK